MAILVFFLILLIVVVGHELGHFFVAKWCGVKVEEFGIGFPPKIWGYRPQGQETEYSINWLPIGGFVRLYGEDGNHGKDPRSFAAKTPWQRIAILSAGVVMNVIIAIVAFTIAGMMGNLTFVDEENRSVVQDPAVTVASVLPDSPAEQADLQFGDRIQQANDTSIDSVETFRTIIAESTGQTVMLQVQRGKEIIIKEVQVGDSDSSYEGKVGASIALAGIAETGFWESLGLAFQRVYVIITTSLSMIGNLIMSPFTDSSTPAEVDVRGPVGLVEVVAGFQDLGIVYLIMFTGLMSTSLAFFNILPIPALDGGRIFFTLIELVKGSAVSETLETRIHTIGYILLLGLMIFVTARDIINLI